MYTACCIDGFGHTLLTHIILAGLQDIERIKREVMEHMRQLAHTPSVQMHYLPPDSRIPRSVIGAVS